jgi:hypothetical protein
LHHHGGTALRTDERLRMWLDGNQPQRERLCLAILGLDRRYTQVMPRRPNGGPDGGRDIEALFEGRAKIWGGVGFRNNVRDSAADKRWVKAKFAGDLKEANKANPRLDHFVFFTNVDLTPGDLIKLQTQGKALGMVVCDIYYRERIRMLLDSPEGLALRYQYLSIDLSSAEQATFFARFGDVLHRTVENRFDVVDRKLARIEFLSECFRPARFVGLGLSFKRSLRSDEIGNLKLLALVMAERKPKPRPTLCIVVTAGPDRITPSSSTCFKSEVTLWAGTSVKQWLGGGQVESFPASERLLLGLSAEPAPGFSTVADFDSVWLHLYANQEVQDAVRTIDFIVNGYVLARSHLKDLTFESAELDDPWLTQCFDERGREKMLSCVDGPTAGTDLPPFAFTDFAAYVPERSDA